MIFLLGLVPNLQAQSMEQAVHDVVIQLGQSGLNQENDAEIILEMVNYHSQKYDRQARVIQGELYGLLQNQFPKARILLKEEAIAGVSFRAVLIKGSYKQEGTQTQIVLNAVKQMNGQLIAKANAIFETQREKFEHLVVVLPIEAPDLKKSVAETYSKILRSELTQTGVFNLVSSDVIDSINADEIQEQYQCTREECSAIVAEQVNANQVITTQYNKITKGSYYLTASLKDIKTGRTLNEVAIQHNGNPETLPRGLKILAGKLAGIEVATSTSLTRTNGKTGMLVIKSNPSQASIMIDGRLLPQKTDTLLQNIPIGKHQITVYKENLGAIQEIILTLDKTEELVMKLKHLESQVIIQSTPNATIYLDGQYIADTPKKLTIGVGKHKLELKKQDYATYVKSIIVKPFVPTNIKARLASLSEVEITSIPNGATVFIDGQRQGLAPLTKKLEPGWTNVTIKQEGYQDFSKRIKIENFKKNRIKGRLKKMLPVSLMITPSVAWIKVDDHYLAYEQNLTLENHNKREKHSTRLSEGKHTLEVGHSQAEQSKKFDIDLIDYGLAIQKTVQLIPKQSYINQLEREKQHQAQNEQYESDMSSWHWNLGLSLVGSGIVALYAYQENQNAQTASEKQKDYEYAILSSHTSAEGATNRDKAKIENDKVKKHNLNTQIGSLVSLTMLGFATWIWIDEPVAAYQTQKDKYESDMSSWSWNLGLSLVGSGIVALYAYQENQNAQAASDNQKDYESAILSSSTSTEGATNRDKAMTENDNVKQHNQNAQIGGLISMGMLGFATWIWLNDPEESKQISWQPNIMSNGNMQMSFNINF